jgi:hypothetical protein
MKTAADAERCRADQGLTEGRLGEDFPLTVGHQRLRVVRGRGDDRRIPSSNWRLSVVRLSWIDMPWLIGSLLPPTSCWFAAMTAPGMIAAKPPNSRLIANVVWCDGGGRGPCAGNRVRISRATTEADIERWKKELSN